MFNHELNLLVGGPDKMPRGGRSVTHHSLEITDVVPGDLGGGAHRMVGEHDLDITLDELLHRQVVILHPMPCFCQPNLLMQPLRREGRVVGGLLC